MRLTAAMQWRGLFFRIPGVAARGRAGGARLGMCAALLAMLAGAPALAQVLPLAAAQPEERPQAAAPPPPAPRPVAPPRRVIVSQQQIQRTKLNQETLIIAASRPGGSYLAMANDLASALEQSPGVRLLPLASEGGLATLKDVLLLRGIDMGIVPANVLAHAKASNVLGAGLAHKVAYLTALYSEEVHIIAGQGIAAVADLRGKKVAVPADDVTAQFTAGDILRHLGVAVESVPMDPAQALAAVSSGTIAAAVLVGGKPLAPVSALPKDGRLRLLSVPSSALPAEGYAPAVLLAEDYPALIPPGAVVETVGVNAVLVVNKANEETARRVARHVPAVLEAIVRLAASRRSTKWRDVNLAAKLPGWSRIEAAETWLNRASAQRKGLLQGQSDEPSPVRGKTPGKSAAAPQGEKVFEEFEAWTRKSVASERAK
jgi:TRAP transporter TAXI family solute receptor